MTALTPISTDQFNTLRLQIVEAMTELTERIDEARARGDTEMVKRLLALRIAIMEHAQQVRLAEIAYLNSPLAPKDAVGQLFNAVKYANRGLQELQDLATALTGATRIVNLLGRLVSLFP